MVTKSAYPYRAAALVAALIPIAAVTGVASSASADSTVDCSSFTFTQTADSLTVAGTVDVEDGATDNSVVLYFDNGPEDLYDVEEIEDGPAVDAPFAVTITGIPGGQYVPILKFGFDTDDESVQSEVCQFDPLTFAASSPTVPSAKTDALELGASTSGPAAILGGAVLGGLVLGATGLLVVRSRRRSSISRG